MMRGLFSVKWVLTTLLVIFGVGLCVRLGFWQLDRLAQRRAFNAQYSQAIQDAPLVLTANPNLDYGGMDFRAVAATGTYDNSNSVVLRNQYYENVPGYFLITPLILSDGSAILVQRGWIPAEGNSSSADWNKYDLAGTIEVRGIIRVSTDQPEIGGNPDPEMVDGKKLEFWNQLNVGRISKQVPYPLLPIFIQPDPNPKPVEPPYPYQPSITVTEGSHLSYALQWFTFATILAVGYPFFLRKQLKARSMIANVQEQQ